MPITTISSREFNQDLSRAKRATKDGPVFITDRGRPAHVLLSIDEFRKVTGAGIRSADALAMPGLEKFDDAFDRELEDARQLSRRGNLGRAADLT